MKKLLAACKDVTDWRALGLQLNLTTSQLQDIEVTCRADLVERIKSKMFDLWLNNSPSASCPDLIAALKSIGEVSVAGKIKASHSGNLPETTGNA